VQRQDPQPGVPLAVVRGIPIRLHWSLFPVFGLIAYSLATNVFRDEIGPGEPDVAWLMGLATSALFLVSIVLHELGHAVVAQRNKLKVGGITLFFFGGIAQVNEEPRTAGEEFRIAAAGPFVSLLLVGGFFALSLVDAFGDLLTSGFFWLAAINLTLLVFNLVPGFPLDGGRILRAIIWHFNGDEAKATRIAVWGGQAVSLLLVGYAIFRIVSGGSLLNGLWLLMLAGFLRNAATSTGAHVMTRSILERVTAGQTMARDLVYIPARARVQEIFEQHQFINPRQAFVVVDEGPLGVISPLQLAFLPRERWPWTVVTQIMTPWRQLAEITPDTSLMNALRQMEESRTQYAVVRAPGGDVQGILSRDQIAIKLQSTAQG
jgi:Zn-dependent protease/CBS domain-containing protein